MVPSKIIIYITQSCPYCSAVKSYLENKKVIFTEIDITSDKKLQEELIKKTGQMGVPVLDIDGEIVLGFDKEKIDKLINNSIK